MLSEENHLEQGTVRPVGIIDQMQSAYLDYSMSVIVSRALPDVRDGLKPVHRRVLYAMERMGLQANRGFRKCAGIVGEVLKDFHPHGDVPVYETLVRLAQPWNMRYPLVQGQGNFGSVDDDPPAAMRYCVTGDTLVVSDRGLVPIDQLSLSGSEDIAVRVLSRNGVSNSASKWWDCGEFPTFRVRTRRGYEITGTGNHPLLVAVPDADSGRITLIWKTIDTIVTGDFVVLDRSDVLWPEQLIDLRAFYPSFAERSRVERHQLPAHLNEDVAFLVGALLAEGTFREQVMEFTHTEGNFADQFVQAWQRAFPTCRLRIFHRKPVGYGKKPFLQMQIVSQEVIAFLKAMGLTGRSAERSLPAPIMRSPKSVVAAFLRGLFEGDGAVERSGRSQLRVSLCARNRTLLQHVQTLLLRFGVISTLYPEAARQMHRLCIIGLDNLSAFASEIGFASAVKREALETMISIHSGRAFSKSDYVPFLAEFIRERALRGQREWLSKHNFERTSRLTATLPRPSLALSAPDFEYVEQFAQQHYLFEQVERIEDAGNQRVYSMRVDSECHSFVANGFVNHNTEARMAPIAVELLDDIEKETVDFRPNYDDREVEPVVLPARLPNLLLNGAAGIAVGMATNIPPHNLREVCDGILHLIDHPDATIEDLLRLIKGPDFPTGGIIHGREGIRSTAQTGRGRIVVRARAHTEETEKGRISIIVTELPYQVNKAELVKKIAELARDKKIDGIADVRDESDRQGIRVVVDLRKDARHLAVLNQLFKYTAMQTAFNANVLALVDGQPRILNLKAILQHYVAYREQVITRRTRFDLRKAQERAHILEGLQIALDHLDEVIATIRQSASSEAAQANLQERFTLSEAQAKAILDMRLGRLAALERAKVAEELAEVRALIARLQAILSDIGEVRKLIKADLAELREKYGDPRRTEIQEDEAGEFTEEDLIPNDEVVVTLTEQNYIKRVPSSTYRAQRRGGKGVTGMTTREDDTVLHLLVTHNHDALLFFTNRGRVFQLATYELPEVGRQAKGEHIRNLIGIDTEERVTAVISVPRFQARDYLVMATRRGEVKKTALDEFAVVRRNGLNAMDLEEGDELIGAHLVHADDQVLLITAHGQSVRFAVTDLRAASRASGGVRGVRLGEGDDVIALECAVPDGTLLIVTERGYGKRTALEEYPAHGRGGSGVLTARLTDRTGHIAAARVLTASDRDLVLMSANGTIIRSPSESIALLSRATQGVRLMNLQPGDRVSAIATTLDSDDSGEGAEVEAADEVSGK
jgi:DNA gyrase subunit A